MPSQVPSPTQKTTTILTLLTEKGTSDYIGEHISQLEHSLQCAFSAQKAGADDDLVLAALLHDIGQFLEMDEVEDVRMLIEDGGGDEGEGGGDGEEEGKGKGSVGRVGHERIGEEYLRSVGFGERVCVLVGSHVDAKRYLTAIDKDYYEGLAQASKLSLKFQGGPFEGEELERFRLNPLSEEMMLLRRWDDGAKVMGIESVVPRVETYRDMMVRHLEVQVSV